MVWTQSGIEVYLDTHRITETMDGEILIGRESAVALLAAIFQEGGPRPAYIDVYSITVDGALHFEEDLAMHDQEPDGQYEVHLLAYLGKLASNCLVAPYDFALGDTVAYKQMASRIDESFFGKSNAK